MLDLSLKTPWNQLEYQTYFEIYIYLYIYINKDTQTYTLEYLGVSSIIHYTLSLSVLAVLLPGQMVRSERMDSEINDGIKDMKGRHEN